MECPSRPATLPPASGDRGAAPFVWGVWVVMLGSVFAFIHAYACNVPFYDEWSLVPALTHHEPVTLKFLWSQHNEHRNFLPRLVYLGLAKLTRGDFRAGAYFTAAGLGLVAAALVVAARRLRGGTSYADAFFPLALLHVAHCENLLWSFQVQFMSSTVLVVGLLLLILHSHRPFGARKALAGGLSLIGLTLCGANGLPFVPPLAVWLGYWALRPRPVSRRTRIRDGALVLALIGAALFLEWWYFVGWHPNPQVPANPGWRATAQATGQVLAMSFGHGIVAWWPWIGYVLGGILAACALALAVGWWRQPAERARCAGLLLFLLSLVGLALGIGWGRAGLGPTQGFWYRYSMLTAPALCGVFFAAEITGSAPLARFVQTGLFTCLAVLLVPNTQAGLAYGEFRYNTIKPVERDVHSGYTSDRLARKHLFIFPDKARLESYLEMLRTAEVGKFKYLRPPLPPESLVSGGPDPQSR